MMKLPISHDQFLLAMMAAMGMAGFMVLVQREANQATRAVYEPKIERLEKQLKGESLRAAMLVDQNMHLVEALRDEWAANAAHDPSRPAFSVGMGNAAPVAAKTLLPQRPPTAAELRRTKDCGIKP